MTDFLKWKVPIALRMISWLNLAIKKLSTMKEESDKKDKLKKQIDDLQHGINHVFLTMHCFII